MTIDYQLHLDLLIQTLENETFLVSARTFPEITCYGDDPQVLRGRLLNLIEQFIRKLDRLELQRRHAAGPVGSGTLQLSVAPPRPAACWREPVTLTFSILRWQQQAPLQGLAVAGSPAIEAWLAAVPTLDIEVLAEKEEERERLLPLHICACLARQQAVKLASLVWLQRCQQLATEWATCAVALPTPRQQALQERERELARKPGVLPQIGTELSSQPLSPAFEMEDILKQLTDALAGQPPRSVLLVGPAGVGKTAVVRELVRRRGELGLGATPFWTTSGARLVAGMTGFGMWQERCQHLWQEASKWRAILHLGHLLELMDVGKSEHQPQGILSFLLPYIGRGDLLTIAECTPEQLPILERQEPHALTIFTILRLEEPSPARGRAILESYTLAAGETLGRLPLEPDALLAVDRLHRRYATYSAYPGRPLRFLQNLFDDRQPGTLVDQEKVTAAFSRETGLPRFLLQDSIPLDLDQARHWFTGKVLGQPEAVDLILDLLATVKTGLTRPRRPIASLLFIGPTGVGKTEMAKALAEFLFGSQQRLTRFDMSEYADTWAVQRLIGGTFTSEGLLTGRVREQPFSVVLLDEFEKGHPALFDLLLQVLGEARLTDAAGRVADFSNSVIIMTSNLGAESYQQGSFGFTGEGDQREQARAHFTRAVQAALRPELFNRIDRIVPFAPLDAATIQRIAELQLEQVRRRDGILYREVQLEVHPAVVSWLGQRGFDARYGARPLRRAIDRRLLAPLAEELNQYAGTIPLRCQVTLADDHLQVTARARTDEKGSQQQLLGSPTELATVQSVIDLRRDLYRLQRGRAGLELVNEIHRLELLLRQIERRKNQWRSPEESQRLDQLPELYRLRAELERLVSESCQREEVALLGLHGQERLDAPALTAALAKASSAFEELLWQLYLKQGEPTPRLVLAIFSEEPWTLIGLTTAYLETLVASRGTGRVALWQVIPATGARRAGTLPDVRHVLDADPEQVRTGRPLRVRALEREKKVLGLEELASSTVGVLGYLLELRNHPWAGLLQEESGLNLLQTERENGKCLVDTFLGEVIDYKPPPGVERRGFIGPQPKRRTWLLHANEAEDPNLERRWKWEGSLSDGLRTLLQMLLRKRARCVLE